MRSISFCLGMYTRYLKIVVFLFCSYYGFSQGNPPVNVEFSIGNNGTNTEIFISKKLESIPRLGAFSATNLITNWGESRPLDIMHEAAITFTVFSGLDVATGYNYTEANGVIASAYLMYTHFGEKHLFVMVPRLDLVRRPDYEVFSFVEFTPKLNDQWSWYSRLQGLYVMSSYQNIHQRSYLSARLGFSHREFSFGLAADWDYFGPEKEYFNNYGLFVSADLF